MTEKGPITADRSLSQLEAPGGLEPPVEALQAPALPTLLRRLSNHVNYIFENPQVTIDLGECQSWTENRTMEFGKSAEVVEE